MHQSIQHRAHVGLIAALFVAMSFGVVSAAPGDAPSRRPNIVLIMADDIGYECVGVNGAESYKTPHLDALAAGGMRFEHCHSQPLCTPSRVQIMTGRYNSRNYVRFGLLDPKATTFANLLRDSGYATCIVGKWQLKGGFDGPKGFGFDEHCLWQLTRRPNRYPNPGLEVNGKEVDYRNGEYGPDIVTDYACDFIERHAKGDKPFLLYYPMMLPHWPFEPTPDSEEWDPEFRRGDAEEMNKPETRGMKYFVDMVAYTDKMVGKIVAKLEDAGVRDNTLIIFTGDNGTYTGITSQFNGQPYRGGKGRTTDNGTHVPLIVSWAGHTQAGAVCGDLVDFSDLLPTLLDAAGVAMPEGAAIDGRSFAPQLRGEPGEPRAWIYCWYYRSGKIDRKGSGEFARDHRYKYYRDGRFFDVVADPQEKAPLGDAKITAEQQRVRERLRSVVERYARSAGARQD